MDIGTGLSILGTAAGSAKVVEKILGPTADYLGIALREWAQKRVENVGKIFQNAQSKLGDKLETEGAVPPNVLKNILEDGSFSDDALSVEYFGGVLASSRTEVSRDDRGAAFAALVGRLTAYEIRTHFIFYSFWKDIFNGMEFNVGLPLGRELMQLYIPINSYAVAMEFSEKENIDVVLTHAVIGLERERLIDNTYDFGHVDHLKPKYRDADSPGILVRPSSFGVELFHWAFGRGDIPISRFLDPTVEFRSNFQIKTVVGSRGTRLKGNDPFGVVQAVQENIPDGRFSTTVSTVTPGESED
jgi:hypothetical protein